MRSVRATRLDASVGARPHASVIGIMRSRPSLLALVLTTAVGIGQIAASYGSMPDRIASHFNAAGNVDGWSSRPAFAATMTALHGVFFLLFFAARPLLLRTPDALINLPHKEWWLAPERREATKAWIADQLAWIGAMAQALMACATRISLCASRGEEHALPGWTHWVLIGGFLLGTAAWVAKLLHHFRLPANARGEKQR